MVGRRKLDNTFLKARIEVCTSFDLKDGNGKTTNKEICWCGGVVDSNSDGTWLLPGTQTKCHKESEAAYML